MLEDFLCDIYEDALTLEMIKEASFYSSIRHVSIRGSYWNDASKNLEKIIYKFKEYDLEKSVELMQGSLKAQEKYDDWHTFSAAIDTEVVPKLTEYLKHFTGINVTEGDWTLESSSTGFLTLKDKYGNYLHSPSDPMWESFLYAYSIYKSDAKRYYILGGGLGYLAYQLWRMSDGEAEIYVLEIDKKVAEYADLYGVTSLIDPEKYHVITGDDPDLILERYADDDPDIKTVRTIYYWNLAVYTGVYSDIFKVLYSMEVSERAFEKRYRKNYNHNMLLEHKYYEDLNSEFNKDEWLVVGAGPSLNDNVDFIKESVGKRTICCINASFKWFYVNGIKPDICTACDPNDSLVPHIKGYEEFSENVPLIADVLANHRYMELYRGSKYYIFSGGAALVIGKNKVIGDIWSFGGTVTSMALEVALKMGAKKVYLIGADLAYPGGVTYANGVGHDVGKWTRNEETVVSVDDKIIPTSVVFREYKYMIENQIAEYPGVEVVNRSLHGAYLKGAYIGQWWENLDDRISVSLFEKLKPESNILGWGEKYFIFKQLLERMSSDERNDNNNAQIINDTYKVIYNAFKDELKWNMRSEGKINSGQTYIFTDEFSDEKDPDTRKVLDAAKKEVRNKKNVLIVNSAEKLGGKSVPMHDRIKACYNADLLTADRVDYGNMAFSYFQFSDNMPDIKTSMVFLDSLSKSKPGKMIKTCKYSILADLCSELFEIPTEIIE